MRQSQVKEQWVLLESGFAIVIDIAIAMALNVTIHHQFHLLGSSTEPRAPSENARRPHILPQVDF